MWNTSSNRTEGNTTNHNKKQQNTTNRTQQKTTKHNETQTQQNTSSPFPLSLSIISYLFSKLWILPKLCIWGKLATCGFSGPTISFLADIEVHFLLLLTSWQRGRNFSYPTSQEGNFITRISTINQVNDLCSTIWTRDGVALVSWLGFAWKFLSQPRVQPSFPAHLCRSQLQRVVFKKCSEVWQCHVATRRWRQWKFQRVKGLRWLCSLRDSTVDPSRKKCDGSTRFLWIIHIVLWWWEWVLEEASACWPRGT